MKFVKWEGLGNDFVFFQGPPPPQAAEWAERICDRRQGVGADGLVFVDDEPRMVLFNADGSRAQMCGNALRCIGAWWVEQGRLSLLETLTVQTDSGPRRVRVLEPDWVEVDMGAPQPIEGFPPVEPIPQVGLPGQFLSMGNPHLVVLCPEGLPAPGDFERWGRWLQTASFVPEGGINVGFAARRERGLDLVVWERGAGPTQACGTAACAAVVAAVRVGWLEQDRVVPVHLPGGVLNIQWTSQGSVWMAGPARKCFEGTWSAQEERHEFPTTA